MMMIILVTLILLPLTFVEAFPNLNNTAFGEPLQEAFENFYPKIISAGSMLYNKLTYLLLPPKNVMDYKSLYLLTNFIILTISWFTLMNIVYFFLRTLKITGQVFRELLTWFNSLLSLLNYCFAKVDEYEDEETNNDEIVGKRPQHLMRENILVETWTQGANLFILVKLKVKSLLGLKDKKNSSTPTRSLSSSNRKRRQVRVEDLYEDDLGWPE
jgi:hypothetical protein